MWMSVSENGIFKLWDSENKLQTRLSLLENSTESDYATAAAFATNGELIALAKNDDTVRLINHSGRAKPDVLAGHNQGISVLAFSPDNDTFAIGSNDSKITLWNRNEDYLKTLEGHSGGILSMAFSSNSTILASSSSGGSLRLWSQHGNLLNILDDEKDNRPADVWSMAFSPVSNTLATAGISGFIEVWELDPQQLMDWNCNWLQDYLLSTPAGKDAAAEGICQDFLPARPAKD